MAKAKSSESKSNGNDSDLNFEAQIRAPNICGQDGCSFSLSASISFSTSDGEKVAKPDEVSGERGKRAGVRCQIEFAPVNNANYAWIHHFFHQISSLGLTDFVVATSPMSTQNSNEDEIRKTIIEADLVDGIVSKSG